MPHARSMAARTVHLWEARRRLAWTNYAHVVRTWLDGRRPGTHRALLTTNWLFGKPACRVERGLTHLIHPSGTSNPCGSLPGAHSRFALTRSPHSAALTMWLQRSVSDNPRSA